MTIWGIDNLDAIDPLERLHGDGASRAVGAEQMVGAQTEDDVLGRERAAVVEDDALAQEEAQGAGADALPAFGQRRTQRHVPGVVERDQRVEHLRHDAACRGMVEEDRLERRRKTGQADS